MIIRNRNFNYTDTNGKEYFEKEQILFPIIATQENINNYPGKQIDVHWHEYYEIFVLDAGKALVSVDGKEHEINEKEACYVGPSALHGVKAIKDYDCNYRSLVIHPNIISGLSGSIFDIKVNKSFQELNRFIRIEDESFFEAFEKIWECLDKESKNYEFVVRNELSKIYLFLDSLSEAKTKENKNNISSLKTMLEWIEENLEEINRIEDIVLFINLSSREIQRLFRHNLNYSPMEYVRRKKILKSADELISSNMAIIDIAYKYGFSSPAHYTLTFKKIMNCKPHEYRKKYK